MEAVATLPIEKTQTALKTFCTNSGTQHILENNLFSRENLEKEPVCSDGLKWVSLLRTVS